MYYVIQFYKPTSKDHKLEERFAKLSALKRWERLIKKNGYEIAKVTKKVGGEVMSSHGEYYAVEQFGDKYVAMYDIEQHLMGEEFDTEEEAQAFIDADNEKYQREKEQSNAS